MTLRRNIIANYFGRAYSVGAIYLFAPFFVQILGVDAYGVIAAYTVLLTLAGLADIGLSATFSREAARISNSKKLLDLLATIERILILTVGFISLVFFVSSDLIVTHWLDHEGEIDQHSILWSFRLMALMIVPHICFSLYSAGLIGLQNQVKANIIQSFFVTVRSGLVLLPILWRPELPIFFAWQLITTLVFAFLTRVALVREMGHSAWTIGSVNTSALKENLVFASGMMWITIVSSINTQIDKLIVSKFFSLTDFGYYSLASSLAQVPIALATPIAVAFYPFVTAHVANRDKAQERKAYDTYGQWIVFMGALGSFGIAFFAPQLLEVWLQDPNLPPVLAEITAFLVIGNLFLCMTIPPYYLGLAHGQSRLIAILATVTMLMSVPLMYGAIQIYGLRGVTFPWLALNLTNFLLFTYLIAWRHVGQGHISVIARIAVFPVVVTLFSFLTARIIADTFHATPIVAFVFAAFGTLFSVLLFVSRNYVKSIFKSISPS